MKKITAIEEPESSPSNACASNFNPEHGFDGSPNGQAKAFTLNADRRRLQEQRLLHSMRSMATGVSKHTSKGFYTQCGSSPTAGAKAFTLNAEHGYKGLQTHKQRLLHSMRIVADCGSKGFYTQCGAWLQGSPNPEAKAFTLNAGRG